MSYDAYLEDRINNYLNEHKVGYRTIKMMGGLCYMVEDKMMVGIIKGLLMCRVGPDQYAASLEQEYVQATVFGDRPMKGMVFVSADGYDLDEDLGKWLHLCLAYNPLAPLSKKKKPK
jgi:TfoX/Sxy family transcriptional regulator of competence genes